MSQKWLTAVRDVTSKTCGSNLRLAGVSSNPPKLEIAALNIDTWTVRCYTNVQKKKMLANQHSPFVFGYMSINIFAPMCQLDDFSSLHEQSEINY